MKCACCHKKIENELVMRHISDGDFVCNNKCEKKYIHDRNEFFDNIGDDKWYEKNYFKLDL